MIGWEAVISGLLVIACFIGGLILRRLEALERKMDSRHEAIGKKLDQKMDRAGCEAQVARCERSFNQGFCQESKELWEALRTHSHTGLPADAKVTR